MAIDRAIDSAQLDADLTAVADAIRAKGGTSEALAFPGGFVSAVQAIQAGSGSSDDSNVIQAINLVFAGDLYNRNLTRVSNNMFSGCKGITRIELPEVLNSDDYSFSGCTALKEAILPKASNVPNFGFNGCTSLRKVVVTAATRLINYCFQNCTSLAILDCAPTTAMNSMNFKTTTALAHLIVRTPSVWGMDGAGRLDTTPIASGEGFIYVPSSLIDSYRAATNWSAYADQFRALEDYTVDGTVTGEFDESRI